MRSNSVKKSMIGEIESGFLESALKAAPMGGMTGIEAMPAPWSVSLDEGVRSRIVTLWPRRRRGIAVKSPAREPPTMTIFFGLVEAISTIDSKQEF